MKKPFTKFAATVQTPVFPQTLHQSRSPAKAANPNPQPQKRDNLFSKSRDTREDRGTREMKTSNNTRSFPSARQ